GRGGVPGRCVCASCGSQHSYRGGGADPRRASAAGLAPATEGRGTAAADHGAVPERRGASAEARSGHGERMQRAGGGEAPLPLVSERERRYPVMTQDNAYGGSVDLEMLFRRVIREEMGLGPAVPADKWRGGEMVL